MTQQNKVKVAFKIHHHLLNQMQQAYRAQYGKKGKSQWIAEAIDELLKQDNFSELVLEEKVTAKLEAYPQAIDVSLDLRYRLDEAIAQCRKKDPFKHGMQSAIIRTAIIQKLLE